MASVASFQIPSELKKFDLSFPCREEQEKEAAMTLAKQVAHVYAKLLTLKGHQERGTEFYFLYNSSSLPKKFPTDAQVENFEKQITDAIVDKFPTVRLSTDFSPQGLLEEVLDRCKIDLVTFDVTLFFPCKIRTEICLDRNMHIIRVEQRQGTFV